MKKSLRELLEESKAKQRPSVQLDFEGLVARVMGKKPRPTQGKFLMDPAPYKAYKGMAGCAKTSTLVGGELLRSITIPGYSGFIAMHNYNDLTNTAIPRFEQMVNRVSPALVIDRDKTPPMRVWLQSPGAQGVSSIMFIGLKDYPGGYEWHHGSVDEADKCDERIILGLKSRLRAPQPEGHIITYGLDLAFNPPDETHWLYPACTGLDHERKRVPDKKWLTLFEPSVGENDENLPPRYYEEQFAGMPQDMLDRLRWGKWGASFPGTPVYRQFDINYHATEENLYNEEHVMFRFWDFGYRHPACIWAQMDDHGGIDVVYERMGTDVEARAFVRECKALTNTRYPHQGRRILDFGDPAAVQKKDTGSTLAVLGDEGISLTFIKSTIDEGVRRLRFLLDNRVEGRPAFRIMRRTCPLTTRMLQGGYRMAMQSDGKGGPAVNRPVKDGFYDHLADALRYGIINLFTHQGRVAAQPDMDFGGEEADADAWPDNIEYQRSADHESYDR